MSTRLVTALSSLLTPPSFPPAVALATGGNCVLDSNSVIAVSTDFGVRN